MVAPEGMPDQASVEQAVRTILAWTGDDPERGALRDTPGRVARTLTALSSGYREDPTALLATGLEETIERQLVVVRDITFHSLCEHHLLPFFGWAAIAYLPETHLAGLSKLARVVDAHARRLQVQERLTEEIATTLERGLRPRGLVVALTAQHLCMSMRGAAQPGHSVVTVATRGELASDVPAREGALRLMALSRP
ncbi:MAG: GTP cyclohydrolase I FolE [Candidatus Dormibacteria bacterium]